MVRAVERLRLKIFFLPSALVPPSDKRSGSNPGPRSDKSKPLVPVVLDSRKRRAPEIREKRQ